MKSDVAATMGPQARLARFAQLAVVFVAAVQVVVAVAFGLSADGLAAAAAAGKSLMSSNTLYENVGHALMCAVVGAYFLVCAWLWRARQLTSRIAPGESHRLSIGYVWVVWLIPIANLWLPARLISDVREVSSQGRAQAGKAAKAAGDPIWWWAVAFASFGVLKGIVPQFLEVAGQKTLQNPIPPAVGWLEWAAAAAAVVAAVLWWRVVGTIKDIQGEASDWPDVKTKSAE